MGDSFVQAQHVDEEKTFMSHIGRNIQKCDAFRGKWIEVIGFGVNGYGTGIRRTQAHRVADQSLALPNT